MFNKHVVSLAMCPVVGRYLRIYQEIDSPFSIVLKHSEKRLNSLTKTTKNNFMSFTKKVVFCVTRVLGFLSVCRNASYFLNITDSFYHLKFKWAFKKIKFMGRISIVTRGPRG